MSTNLESKSGSREAFSKNLKSKSESGVFYRVLRSKLIPIFRFLGVAGPYGELSKYNITFNSKRLWASKIEIMM